MRSRGMLIGSSRVSVHRAVVYIVKDDVDFLRLRTCRHEFMVSFDITSALNVVRRVGILYCGPMLRAVEVGDHPAIEKQVPAGWHDFLQLRGQDNNGHRQLEAEEGEEAQEGDEGKAPEVGVAVAQGQGDGWRRWADWRLWVSIYRRLKAWGADW